MPSSASSSHAMQPAFAGVDASPVSRSTNVSAMAAYAAPNEQHRSSLGSLIVHPSPDDRANVSRESSMHVCGVPEVGASCNPSRQASLDAAASAGNMSKLLLAVTKACSADGADGGGGGGGGGGGDSSGNGGGASGGTTVSCGYNSMGGHSGEEAHGPGAPGGTLANSSVQVPSRKDEAPEAVGLGIEGVMKVVSLKKPAAGGRPTKVLRCQVESCGHDLSQDKIYYQRHHVCRKHLNMICLDVGGKPSRFCQQCRRFHDLKDFDANKRSCRVELAKHNERRRKAATQGGGTERVLQGLEDLNRVMGCKSGNLAPYLMQLLPHDEAAAAASGGRPSGPDVKTLAGRARSAAAAASGGGRKTTRKTRSDYGRYRDASPPQLQCPSSSQEDEKVEAEPRSGGASPVEVPHSAAAVIAAASAYADNERQASLARAGRTGSMAAFTSDGNVVCDGNGAGLTQPASRLRATPPPAATAEEHRIGDAWEFGSADVTSIGLAALGFARQYRLDDSRVDLDRAEAAGHLPVLSLRSGQPHLEMAAQIHPASRIQIKSDRGQTSLDKAAGEVDLPPCGTNNAAEDGNGNVLLIDGRGRTVIVHDGNSRVVRIQGLERVPSLGATDDAAGRDGPSAMDRWGNSRSTLFGLTHAADSHRGTSPLEPAQDVLNDALLSRLLSSCGALQVLDGRVSLGTPRSADGRWDDMNVHGSSLAEHEAYRRLYSNGHGAQVQSADIPSARFNSDQGGRLAPSAETAVASDRQRVAKLRQLMGRGELAHLQQADNGASGFGDEHGLGYTALEQDAGVARGERVQPRRVAEGNSGAAEAVGDDDDSLEARNRRLTNLVKHLLAERQQVSLAARDQRDVGPDAAAATSRWQREAEDLLRHVAAGGDGDGDVRPAKEQQQQQQHRPLDWLTAMMGHQSQRHAPPLRSSQQSFDGSCAVGAPMLEQLLRAALAQSAAGVNSFAPQQHVADFMQGQQQGRPLEELVRQINVPANGSAGAMFNAMQRAAHGGNDAEAVMYRALEHSRPNGGGGSGQSKRPLSPQADASPPSSAEQRPSVKRQRLASEDTYASVDTGAAGKQRLDKQLHDVAAASSDKHRPGWEGLPLPRRNTPVVVKRAWDGPLSGFSGGCAPPPSASAYDHPHHGGAASPQEVQDARLPRRLVDPWPASHQSSADRGVVSQLAQYQQQRSSDGDGGGSGGGGPFSAAPTSHDSVGGGVLASAQLSHVLGLLLGTGGAASADMQRQLSALAHAQLHAPPPPPRPPAARSLAHNVQVLAQRLQEAHGPLHDSQALLLQEIHTQQQAGRGWR